MQSVGERIRLVVLDFDGVCTPSAGEFIGSETALPTIRPELGSVVRELRARETDIVLLSNEFDRAWISEIDGLPEFDHILVGSDNNIFKPDRRAFQRALYVTETEPARCLVVDDDLANVTVAASIGCQAVHFDTTEVERSWRTLLDVAVGPDDAG